MVTDAPEVAADPMKPRRLLRIVARALNRRMQHNLVRASETLAVGETNLLPRRKPTALSRRSHPHADRRAATNRRARVQCLTVGPRPAPDRLGSECFGLVCQQQRQHADADQFTGGPSKQRLPPGRLAVPAEDDKIGPFLTGGRQNLAAQTRPGH